MCELRLARSMMSGPPAKEPKGGVPVAGGVWAEAARREKRKAVKNRSKKQVPRVARDDFEMSRVMACPLQGERAGGEASVEGDGLELEIEDQAVVQELLDVKWNSHSVNSA